MHHIGWLTQEVHRIHDQFQVMFYLIVTVLLLLAVVLEYFKFPLGGIPSFGPIVGRVLIAAILLHSYPTVSNTVADLSDALSKNLGSTAGLEHGLEKLSDRIDYLPWSWVSLRQNIIIAVCWVCFFLLYFSVRVAESLFLYTLVILYLFSPVLIALFVFPRTAGATSALYRSLIEAAMWKPVWCCIGTVLWSTGISDISTDTSAVNFLSAICFCLIAAGSLVVTPKVIHALAGHGMSAMAGSLSNIGIDGVGTITPIKAAIWGQNFAKRSVNLGLKAADLATLNFPKANQFVNSLPRLRTPQKPSLFVRPEPSQHVRKMSPGEQANFEAYGVKPPDIVAEEKKLRKS